MSPLEFRMANRWKQISFFFCVCGVSPEKDEGTETTAAVAAAAAVVSMDDYRERERV